MLGLSALVKASRQHVKFAVRKCTYSLLVCHRRYNINISRYAKSRSYKVTCLKSPHPVFPIYHHLQSYSQYSRDVVDASTDGKNATVVWENGQSSRFHSKWLRFNCRCPVCVNSETNMGRIEVENLPMKMTLKDINLSENGTVKVTWNEDSHEGIFTSDFLKEYCYSEEKLRDTRKNIRPKFFTENKILSMSWNDVEKSEKCLYRWLKIICERGLCLLTDVPRDIASLHKVLRSIGHPTGTLYGETWDVKSMKTPTNIAYSPVKLHFHMDLLFYSSSPGIQLLHCLRFDESVTGGETLFVDMFHVIDEFRKMHPGKFKTLSEVPAMFWRIHDKRDEPVNMVHRKPIIETNDADEVIAVSWHPHILGPPIVNDGNVEEFYNAVQILAQVVQEFPYMNRLRYKEGDMICFNNKRMVHGRTAYDAGANGARHLQGGYVNIDDFKSKLKVLAQKYDPGMPIPRVGNSDWL